MAIGLWCGKIVWVQLDQLKYIPIVAYMSYKIYSTDEYMILCKKTCTDVKSPGKVNLNKNQQLQLFLKYWWKKLDQSIYKSVKIRMK